MILRIPIPWHMYGDIEVAVVLLGLLLGRGRLKTLKPRFWIRKYRPKQEIGRFLKQHRGYVEGIFLDFDFAGMTYDVCRPFGTFIRV